MFARNPSSPCEPYRLPLPLTVIHPRALCTFAAGVSAMLQHTVPASLPHSYTVEPCLHFPVCNQPWLRHTAADQFFSFNPTTVPNHHPTHILTVKSQTLQYSHLPNLKWKNTFSRYCTLGIKDFRKIWFVGDMILLYVPVSSISQHRPFHCTLTGLNLQLSQDRCFTLYVHL